MRPAAVEGRGARAAAGNTRPPPAPNHTSRPTNNPLPLRPQAEALSLRRALADAQRKLHALSTDTGAIDRRIVVKMLITYFEKDYSGEGLVGLGSGV